MFTPHHRPLVCRHAAYQLDGRRGTIPAARRLARAFLSEFDPPVSATALQDTLTLVSELVTNAVRHAPGPCSLYLVQDGPSGRELTVAVSDTSTTPPTARTPDLDGAGGLGWHLIQLLSTRVQVHRVIPQGKTIETTLNTVY